MNKLNLSTIKKFLIVCTLSLLVYTANAQLATYPFRSSGVTPQPGTGNAFPSSTGLTNANVTAGKITVGNSMTSATAGSFNGLGLRIKTNSLTWPTAPTDGFHIDVPLSPKANYDFKVTGIQFKDTLHENTVDFLAKVAYQIDGTGSWNFIGTSTNINTVNTIINFGALNQGFYDGHTYTFRIYFYANSNSTTVTDKNNAFRINFLVFNGTATTPPAINPDVHTTGVSNTGFYSTIASGTYDIGAGFRIVNQAGFLCGTNNTPTFANATPTYVTTLGSPMSETINGLTPGVSYYVRAFAITQSDTILANIGEIVFVKTSDPQQPLINTFPPAMASVVKATTGGWGIDSAGSGVLEKGILYSTNPVMTYPVTTHTSDGKGNSDFVTKITTLLPNTKYYVMAYARNAIGVGYGNLDSVITGPPAPYITATPDNLDFGDLTYNSSPTVLSYKINAGNINPSGGNISLNATNGYTICSTYNGTYSNSLNLVYSAGSITNKIIYVKTSTSSYGNLSGIITHSGGGVVAPNADTVRLNTNVIQNADTLSNAGTDFWCGFGYQEKMDQKATNTAEAKLSIYVTTGNTPATVHVDLTSGGYAQTFTIPANSYHEFNNFPTGDPGNNTNTGGFPDSRLYKTGISNKSIHIYSDNGIPVSAFLHSYTDGNSAAGAMLFPSNTWNSSYIVQAFGGTSNNSNPNSFFFVIANQDNTVVKFKPTQPILDSSATSLFNSNVTTAGNTAYAAGTEYTITLNKGQVFNAMGGFTSGDNAFDLSGSTVSTTCDKKITVFGGNGRCLVGLPNPSGCSPSQGSDHLIQQMFPSVAWGTRYLTMPTKGERINYFRIYVQNPTLYGTTKVWVNDPSHTTPLNTGTLINNLYYEFKTAQPSLIESDKPINVTQFIISPNCITGSIDGGPEMIMLSPIQQAISSVTVFSAAAKKSGAVQTLPNGSTTGTACSYINVIIPTSDTGNFRLDGSNLVDTGTTILYSTGVKIPVGKAFKVHPQDPNYSMANIWVQAPMLHTLKATKGFNAIAYGLGNGESYGYNAGTTINNLSAVNVTVNPNGTDTSSGSVKTVKNNLVYLQIAVPYDTTTITSIIWDGQGNTNVNPNTPQNGIINPNTSKPLCLGTIVKDGRTFYIYQSPVQYTFTEDGAYKIKVTFNGTFVSDCGGFDVKYINVIVGHDDISFNPIRIPANDCFSKTIQLFDNSTGFAGTTIKTYIWDYGDNTKKDTVTSTQTGFPYPTPNSHTYPSNAVYYIKLTTINSIGGVTTDSFKVDLSLLTAPTFSISKDSTCPNTAVVFTPLTSTGADKWFWDYGDGSAVDSTTTQTPVSHSYTAEGIQTVSHWIKNSAGCPSNVTKDTVFVFHKPIADFILPSGVCLPGFTLFTNTSDTAVGLSSMPYTYRWDFGVLDSTSDTSNLKDPSYKYTRAPGVGEYNVSLVATSKYGCVSATKTQLVNNVYAKPTAIVASSSSKKSCAGSPANFVDGSTAVGQTITNWYWNFGDGNTSIVNPASNTYTSNITYTVKLAVGTNKGCWSDTATWTIKVNPKPTAATVLPSSCITSGSLLFQDNSTVATDDSVQTPYTWTWNFGDGPAVYTTKDSTHTYAGIGTYIITHSIATLNGCTDTHKDTFKISGSKPVPHYRVVRMRDDNNNYICNADSLRLIDSSTIATGTISKVVIYWDTSATRYPGLNLNTTPFTDNSPQNGTGTINPKTYSFKYPYSNLSKTPVIRILTHNSDSCYSETFVSVTVFGSARIVFDTIKGICIDGAPKKINLAYDSSGFFDFNNHIRLVAGSPSYSGPGVYNDSMFNPALAGAGTSLIKVLYETKLPLNHGCKDSAYAPITVWGLPQPAIQISNPACEKNQITFTDKTPAVTGSGNISGWTWHFGEPSSGANDSSKINPAPHTYAGAGSYNVTLTAISDSGCVGTMATPLVVNVSPLPKVSFTPPSGTCPGSPSYFTSTSTISDTSKLSYLWNFGEPSSGASNTSIANPAGHTYGTGGPTDSIRLIVYSTNGCSDSLITKLGSLPTLPIIVPSYKIDGVLWDTNIVKKVCLGTPLNFTASFKANDYSWVFGDSAGVINKGATVAHTYPATNSYTGSFTTIDSNGCQTRAVPIKIEVVGLPNVDFTFSNPTCEKNSITFTNNTTPGVGATSITSWLWNFGDPTSGANDSSKIKDPNHTYATYAGYNVSLTATNDNGCKATIAVPKVVNVHPLPKVVFTNPSAICSGNALAFTDNSTIADGTEAQFKYTWNFGDGATTSGVGNAGTSHVYYTSPTDSVRLIITSKDNCKDSLVKVLPTTVHIPNKIKMSANNVAYNAATDTVKVCLGNVINFKNTNTPNPTKTYWDLGNPTGVVVNGNTQSYTYPAAQMYYGMHYADDNNNCRTDTVNFKVLIWSLPTVAFDTVLIKCEKSSVVFTDKSVANYGSIVSWLWNFGDPTSGASNSSTLNSPPHTYSTYGSYDVTLKVTTSNGCSATLSPAKKIQVNPKPKANFVMQDTTCLPNATTFTSTSTIADGTTPVGHLWNFGDPGSGLNNTSISNPTSHNYSSVSDYNVQLIVVSAFGCADTSAPKKLKSNSLHNPPVAFYTVSTISHDTPRVCVGTPITFKDASSNVKTSYWIWDMNNPIVELGGTPAAQFGTTPAGTYYGQHYIDDNWGCRSQPTPIVTIIDAYPKIEGVLEKYVLANTPNLLTPTITDAATINWKVTSPGGLLFDYLDFNDVETPICTPPTDITYLITAKSEFGCSDTASYYVKLLRTPQIPTAFSPNGDNINDYWVIDNLKEYPGATVQVFDRYGQVVLNKFGYSSPWNGKKAGNGEDLPIGVYYYIIKRGLGLPLMTGYVTILR